ncbi:hypothetical protein ACTFIW_005455 [Dictyostelium discoideum]
MAMVAYSGIESIAQLSAETKSLPGIPKVIILTKISLAIMQGIKVSGTLEIQKIKISALEPVKISQIIVPLKHGKHLDVMQIGCMMAKFYQAKIMACHVIEVPSSLPLQEIKMLILRWK